MVSRAIKKSKNETIVSQNAEPEAAPVESEPGKNRNPNLGFIATIH